MKKLYSLIVFLGITFFALGQEIKTSQTTFSSDIVRAKVIRLFPNPAVNVIYFEFMKPIEKELTLQVFNFIGKKVLELNVVSQKVSVPLTDFYRGLYIFQLRDKSGRVLESGKFQVNR